MNSSYVYILPYISIRFFFLYPYFKSAFILSHGLVNSNSSLEIFLSLKEEVPTNRNDTEANEEKQLESQVLSFLLSISSHHLIISPLFNFYENRYAEILPRSKTV